MAFTYGFYNSLSGDRKYNAEQISAIFDGIIKDGVFNTVDQIFGTIPGDGLQVLVKSGRAWFNRTWNYNDASLPLSIDTPDSTLPRKDCVVLEINNNQAVRRNRIIVLKGTPATTPVRPTLTKAGGIFQYPLADVTVRAQATSITAGDISVRVGTSECPFVSGILSSVNIDVLFQEWQHDFDAWFSNIKDTLEGDVATNLQRQIDDRLLIASKAGTSEIYTGTNDTKYITPLGIRPLIGYAFGTSPTNSTAKIVTLTNRPNWDEVPGTVITVYFQYGLQHANTINVNGKGAKKVIMDVNGPSAPVQSTVTLVYTGSVYVVLGVDFDATKPPTLLYSKFTAGTFSFTPGTGVTKLGVFMGAGGPSGKAWVRSIFIIGTDSLKGPSRTYSLNITADTSGAGKTLTGTVNCTPGVALNGTVGSGGIVSGTGIVPEDPDSGGQWMSDGAGGGVHGGSTSFASLTVSGTQTGEGTLNPYDSTDTNLYALRGGKASTTGSLEVTYWLNSAEDRYEVTGQKWLSYANNPEIFSQTSYPRGTRANGAAIYSTSSITGISATGPSFGGGSCAAGDTADYTYWWNNRRPKALPGAGGPGFIMIYDMTGR